LAFAALGGAAPRVRLAPQFAAGQTLRYQIESRDVTSGETTAPIVNPEGGTHSTETIHLTVRLDVIGPVANAVGVTHLRATCEKCSAEFQGDALDLTATRIQDQYNRMQGHSLEFIVQPAGQVVGVQGSDPVFGDAPTAQALLSWLGRIAYGGVPREGIALGEKWKSQRPLPEAPLTGLIWRTESSYVRDESCGRAANTASPSASKTTGSPAPTDCAIIFTRFQISRSGSSKSDATPEEYRRNGLRTAGKWSGSGESEDSISLASGILINSTQMSAQDLDYRITGAGTASTIHHVGRIDSNSQIQLLPPLASSAQ
jgi:hypothetical protein